MDLAKACGKLSQHHCLSLCIVGRFGQNQPPSVASDLTVLLQCLRSNLVTINSTEFECARNEHMHVMTRNMLPHVRVLRGVTVLLSRRGV